MKKLSNIDEYLREDVSADQKPVLEHVRRFVKEVLPDAEEVITYGMPGYKYKQRYLIAYYGFKDHMSIFPGSSPVASLQDKLKGFKQSKGTIQFTSEKPLPDDLLREIIVSSAAEIDNHKTGY